MRVGGGAEIFLPPSAVAIRGRHQRHRRVLEKTLQLAEQS